MTNGKDELEQWEWKKIPEWDSPHDSSHAGCDHPTLNIIVRGQNEYLCKECQWTFQIFGALKKPWSWAPAEAMFKLAAFAKHKGIDALVEGLMRPFPRRDVERIDGVQQRQRALPEGMTIEQVTAFQEFLSKLSEVDIAPMLDLPEVKEDSESEDARLPKGDSQQVSG